MLGVKGRGLALIDLEGGASAPVLLNERGSSRGDHLGVAEFRADGGVLLFDDEGSGLARIEHFDAEARLQSALSVGNAEDGEVLGAAVQIGPGRYVLAGIRRASGNGRSGIVALRYDLDATGGRVVWQRRLVAGNGADVLAAVASGDGGLVLSAWAAEGGATPPGRPAAQARRRRPVAVAYGAAGARQRLAADAGRRLRDALVHAPRHDAEADAVSPLSAPCCGRTACR